MAEDDDRRGLLPGESLEQFVARVSSAIGQAIRHADIVLEAHRFHETRDRVYVAAGIIAELAFGDSFELALMSAEKVARAFYENELKRRAASRGHDA